MFFLNTVKTAISWNITIKIFWNVIYSCDGKAECSVAITLVFSFTRVIRNYSNMLLHETFLIIIINVENSCARNRNSSKQLVKGKLSYFTHPHVVPNLHKFLSNVEHRISFEEPNSCWSPITSIEGKEILRKSMGTINSLITSILQSVLFYVQQTQTGVERHESE